LLSQVGILGAIWGTSVLLQRVAVAEVAPVPLVALRLICATLVLLPFAGRLGQAITRRPRLLLHFFAIGVLNPVLSGVFTALALQCASSGVVAVLQTLSPITTADACIGSGQPERTRRRVAARASSRPHAESRSAKNGLSIRPAGSALVTQRENWSQRSP